MGFRYGRPGGSTKALTDEDARDDVSENLYEKVIQYFEEDLGVALTSVLNVAGTWVITVPDDAKLSNLPGMLARTPCTYKFISDMEDPPEAAFRREQPQGTEWDTSSYNILRPGVMLSSGDGLNPERLTSSGIKVRNNDGTYITVATNGFPDGRATVYHPNGNGQVLGTVHDRLAYTDISLLQLLPDKSYENQTFDTSTSDGETLSGMQVNGPVNPFPPHLRRYSIVSMNNPFVGYIEGVHVTTEKRRVPSDEPGVPHVWVSNEWVYVGNGREDSLQGSCGSVVLDEDSNAVSFFRFELAQQPGYAIGVAASTLQQFGYSVSE